MNSEGLVRGFILHRRPYSETSLILDVFSEQQGRVSVLAKGARSKRSHLKGTLQAFTPLLLKWSGKSGNMKTLRHAESISLALPLSGNYLYSAMYVNELLARVVENETAHPELFYDYINVLTELADISVTTPEESEKLLSPEPALRRFELALLRHLGYGVDFMHCAATGNEIDDQMTYLFREQQGFIASIKPSRMSFKGIELRAMAEGTFTDPEQLKVAKRFTRMVLKPYLGNTPLKSRELFIKSPKQRV